MPVGTIFEEGHPRLCRACQAPLIGALTAAGKTAPVTMEPKENGNVLVFTLEGKVNCRTFKGPALEALREAGVPLRLNHFADCPQAERFRKR